MAIKIKKNNIGNIESSLDKKEPKLTSTEDNFSQISFYFSDIYDPKKIKSFVNRCEKMIRSSDAYSSYIGDLRNDKGLNRCAIKGNITDEDANIEFHHYPFTLYDIVYTVILEHIMNKKQFTSFSISNLVLNLHSENIIGLVPLSITEHQLVHDGVKSIPTKSVYGNVNEFVYRYNAYFDDEIIEKYNILINIK